MYVWVMYLYVYLYIHKPAVLLSVYTEMLNSLKCSPDMITTHNVTIPDPSSTLTEVVLNPTRTISAGVFGSSHNKSDYSSVTDNYAQSCPDLKCENEI